MVSPIGPELLYIIYSVSFPFISYYLFHIAKQNSHQRKDRVSTFLTFSLLISILYTFMYLLGTRVYTFLFPVLAMTGTIPILKLIALELNVLSADAIAHVRGSFVKYYLFLISPSEVVFCPEKDVVDKATMRRLKIGVSHLIFLVSFNFIVAHLPVSEYNIIIRGLLSGVQLTATFSAATELVLCLFGILTHQILLEDVFNLPYLAASPKEFWGKRWNLVIHKYVFKILYIPLGGKNNQTIALAAIYLSVGLLHEIPMFFIPSAKFGYWSLIFVKHMVVMMLQMYLEKKFPKIMALRSTKIITRVITLILLMLTADLAYSGFGMTVESTASDFNKIVTFPLSCIY